MRAKYRRKQQTAGKIIRKSGEGKGNSTTQRKAITKVNKEDNIDKTEGDKGREMLGK